MGAMAESFGLRAGIRYRGPVKRELEATLRIDPAFDGGAADRALGRWYHRVPGLFGGSKDKAVEHLRRALAFDPANPASHYFLAETLLALGRRDDARREFEAVLVGDVDPAWEPEGREFRAKARTLLAAWR
jgi:tetratricopeptide (TPR) repeat protein